MQPVFVTLCLRDSLPADRDFATESMPSGPASFCIDRLLHDRRAGSNQLCRPTIARCVVEGIHYCARTNFILHSWAVMPNHVHLLLTPRSPLHYLVRKLKDVTSAAAGGLLWQDGSYDHLVVGPEEFRDITNYIEQNPVDAGLARSADRYPWSSAYAPPAKPAAA